MRSIVESTSYRLDLRQRIYEKKACRMTKCADPDLGTSLCFPTIPSCLSAANIPSEMGENCFFSSGVSP